MHQNVLLKEMEKALDDEISYLKEHGGSSRFVCRNGILIDHRGNQYVYEFILETPIIFQEDTPIVINYESQRIGGSILRIEGVSIIIALNQAIGEKVPEIIVMANPYFLLEILKEKLKDLEARPLELQLKVFGKQKTQLSKLYNFISKRSGKLNKEQKEALASALGSEVIFIWGPPGTGKTYVLAQIIEELILRGKTILLVSHTNIAVDNALERLSKNLKEDKNELYLNGKILRIGSPHLESLFENYPELDIARWVERKSKDLKDELEKIIKQKEEKKSQQDFYEKIIECFNKLESGENEYKALERQLLKLEKEKEQLESFIGALNRERSDIEKKLSLARNINPLQRLLKGLNISKLNRKLNEIMLIIKDKETELENDINELKELKAKIYQLKESLVSNINRIRNYYKILGSEYTKEEILNEVNSLRKEIANIDIKINNLNEYLNNLERELILESKVIGTTLTKVYLNKNIYDRSFDVMIIDEASMAPMPAIFFACSLIKEKVIVIGDFRQLSPIAQSDSAEVEKWLKRDIFEESGITQNIKVKKLDERVIQLKEQRRMPEEIVQLINEIVYNNTLRTGEKDKKEKNDEIITLRAEPFAGKRIIICDTSSVNPWCGQSVNGSPFNVYQAFLSIELAKIAVRSGVKDIGIITPYTAQSTLIHQLVVDSGEICIDPSSIHRFQGREKQLIIFDLVEGPVRKIKWLNGDEESDAIRLINVAITRSKAKLIFVANLQYLNENLSKNSVLKKILERAKNEAEIVDSRKFFDFVDIEKRRKEKEKTGSDDFREKSAFYSEYYFYEQFRKDLEKARESIIIISPFITTYRTSQFQELFQKVVRNKIKMFIITKPFKEQGIYKEETSNRLFNELKKIGIKIIEREHTHEKLAIIDYRIIWSGSLNILSHKNTQEIMIRIVYEKKSLAHEILKLCGINIAELERKLYEKERLEEINKNGFGTCPKGHKMIVKRGSKGLFLSCSRYPECKETAQVNENILVAIYGEEYLLCNECGSKLEIKYNPKTKSRFIGCSNYPNCRFTRPL